MFSVSVSVPARQGAQFFQFGSACACGVCGSRVLPRVGFCYCCGEVLPVGVDSPLAPLMGPFGAVGFSGSRSCRVAALAVREVISVVGERSVLVGCASGVDSVVRGFFGRAQVFSVKAQHVAISRKKYRVALAQRSEQLVRAVVEQGGLLVVAPGAACPVGLAPARKFHGLGSGSWGSAALAAGLGGALLVWAGHGVPQWVISRGVLVSSWWFVPAQGSKQGSLF